MDENISRNTARLCGVIAAAPVFSHSGRGECFYTFPLEVARLSGATDKINIIVRDELMESIQLCEAEKICVVGELRSFNNKSGEGAKLVITVFAKELYLCDDDDLNEVHLIGTLCKKPNLRMTPMGRDICDLMLAVNRRYGRSDYLPCITWGLKAREAAEWGTGTMVTLEGRIQSRNYIKIVGGDPVEKTAFEVSVTDIAEFT
ncbi:single-strand binding family protein [Firmicutes bacterium CAG:555]|nr:single-strand binding family protein [Firmicutes bacterium CAG:555]